MIALAVSKLQLCTLCAYAYAYAEVETHRAVRGVQPEAAHRHEFLGGALLEAEHSEIACRGAMRYLETSRVGAKTNIINWEYCRKICA